jgi:hypothetical protein
MTAIERYLGRRALRATVRYSWHRMVAKVQNRPLRSVTLLSAGGVVGLIVGWLAGRRTPQPPPPPRTP